MKPKVLIVDDHEIVREGIRKLLTGSRPGWEICGEAANGKQAVDSVKSLKPDVVIFDITMPGMTGLEAAPHILKLSLGCRILIFTMHYSDRLAAKIREPVRTGTFRNRKLPETWWKPSNAFRMGAHFSEMSAKPDGIRTSGQPGNAACSTSGYRN